MAYRFISYGRRMRDGLVAQYAPGLFKRLSARLAGAGFLPFGFEGGRFWGEQYRICLALGLAFIAHIIVLSGVHFKIPNAALSPLSKKNFEITVFHPALEVAPAEKKPPASLIKQPRKEAGKPVSRIKEMPQTTPKDKVEKFHQANPAQDALIGAPNTPAPHLNAALLAQQVADFGHSYTQQRIEQAREKRIVYVKNTNKDHYEAIEYERACWEKIERIGKLNYPDAARGKELSGSLRIAVGINQEGGIYSVKILQSSGEQVLDEAAVHIVRLAAPFAPLPVALSQQVDVLVITGVWDWRFLNDKGTQSER
jgi:protein TonB